VDRIIPPGTEAYDLLTTGSCAQLLTEIADEWNDKVVTEEGADTVRVYTSAAYICDGRWNEAKHLADQIPQRPAFSGSTEASSEDLCVRGAVLAWVRTLLAERAKDPSFTPMFVTSSSRSRCENITTSTTTSFSSPSSTSSTSFTTTSSSSASTSTTTVPR
jgi:hypothetical protein